MFPYETKLREFAVKLFEVNAIKFGDFKTKVGLWTPVYCDLRVLVSHPKLLEDLAELIIEKTRNISLDIICGVPLTALPIATVVSMKTGYPMVMKRKEAKDYGTKKLIEGNYKKGDRCMIVEDVVTSGSSILETVKDLQNAEIKTTDAVVLLNREQGAEDILKENGIRMHALMTMTQLMEILKTKGCISKEISDKVAKYLIGCQIDSDLINSKTNRLKMPYSDRMLLAQNPVTKELFKIMNEKQTNLCVAADLTQTADILNLAEQVGPHICIFKTHVDIVEDFNDNFIKNLKAIADRHNFMLLEDRKFADIGNTVELQYSKGMYHIASWAKLITVHSVMGKGILDVFQQIDNSESHGVFLLAQSSTEGLINDYYTNVTIDMAKDYSNLVTGFVCQTPLFSENPEFIQLTPGVQLNNSVDNLDQHYNSPENVILEKGADVAVVGRGIIKSNEPATAAENYKNLLWDAYKKRTLKI